MKVITFHDFKLAVSAQMLKMEKHTLFFTDVSKDERFQVYLEAFPEGTNPIKRERTENDCNCCNRFIRAAGNMVAMIDGELVSIWDIDVGGHYQVVADAMSAFVKSAAIGGIYLHDEPEVGVDYNFEEVMKKDESGKLVKVVGAVPVRWEHFHQRLPSKVVVTDGTLGSVRGDVFNNKTALLNSITSLSDSAIETVLELIEGDLIYRGNEQLSTVNLLKELKAEYAASAHPDSYVWLKAVEIGEFCSIKGTMVGALIGHLSNGKSLEYSVKEYEKYAAPENYKRPQAIEFSPGQIKRASKRIAVLGLESALPRRFAVLSDITINDTIFVDRSVKESFGLFDLVKVKSKKVVVNDDAVTDIHIEEFLKTVVSGAESMEVLVGNTHATNFVSLISPIHAESGHLFKWNNNSSWSYEGEVTDSMAQRVEAKGGRTDGDLRFTHEWNHTGQNQSLMDLHMFLPDWVDKEKALCHDSYGNSDRVGWNRRTFPARGIAQDVDFTDAPGTNIPLENITCSDMAKLKDGRYLLRIHNWRARKPNLTGFKAEVAIGSQVYQYTYDKPLAHKEWVTVATVTLNKGMFTIEHHLPHAATSMDVWGIPTEKFAKVKILMNSPNFWEGNAIGNKHYFFMLDDCANPNEARGFYNEFLRDELHPDRKVFEHLAGQLKAPKSDEQLSGLGFSSTVRNNLICKVRGATNRTYNIQF